MHRASRLVKVERAAQNGDVAVIDYVGTVDGVAFNGGTAQDHELKLGSGQFIPGFEEQLVGAVAGEKRDVKVKFPDEYHAEDLKGKDAVFAVTVKEVREEEVPALDDAFVKDHSAAENVEAYKAEIRGNLQKSAEQRTRNERIDAVMSAVTDAVDCEIPDKIVNAEVDRLYDDFAHRMSHYGIKPEDYLKYSNSSVAQFRDENRPHAERNVKMRLVMRAIIDAEKIEPTEDEIKAKLDDPRQRAQFEAESKHSGVSPVTLAANDALTDKFFDFLLSKNEFVLDKAETEDKAEAKAPAKKPAAKKTTASGDTAKKTAAKKPAAKKTEDKKDGE